MNADCVVTTNIGEINDRFNNAKERALIAIGMAAERHAKEYCTAVDTGRLRNSITFATSTVNSGEKYKYKDNHNKNYDYDIGAVTSDKYVYIGSNVEYAPYIEYGHHSYAGLHYLKKAAADHKEEYKRLVEESMRNA